jgi:serine/threonine protein kinase
MVDEGGELFDRIVERRRYSEAHARELMYRLLSALAYAHSIGVVHRDLKVSVRACVLALQWRRSTSGPWLNGCLDAWPPLPCPLQPENVLLLNKNSDTDIKLADWYATLAVRECGGPHGWG